MAENLSALGQSRTKFVVFLGVAAAVFLLTFMTAALITFILPETFSSFARVKIEPDSQSTTGKNGGYDPYVVQTEFEVIQSEPVLSKVVENMDLTNEWGKRYAGGEKLRSAEAIALLKRRIELRPIRNTSMLEIRVFSENPKEAADIANNVAEAYRAHRIEQRRNLAASGIDVLEKQFREQEDRVHDAQNQVDRLRQELNISEVDALSNVPAPTLDADTVRRLQGELISFQSMLAKEKAQLAGLQELSPEERRNVIPTAIGPDNDLTAVLKDLNAAEQNLISMEKDYSPTHPAYRTAKDLVASAEKRVNARVEGIMWGLSNRVTGLEASVTTIQKNLESARESDLVKAKTSRPYYEAKLRLQDLQNVHRVLSMKLSSERADANLPKSTLISIIDRAQPGIRPVRPNKPLNLFVGACGGMFLALIVGGGAAWLVSLIGRKSKGPPPAAA